jgi:fumarylacetoacetase
VDETHAPALRSWVESAQAPGTDFPIQNLPFGVADGRVGVAIGDRVLNVAGALDAGLFGDADTAVTRAAEACRNRAVGIAHFKAGGIAREIPIEANNGTLNRFMALGPSSWTALRRAISELLRVDTARLRDNRQLVEDVLLHAYDSPMHAPVVVGDYTDFYASIYHATNVGRLFRPDNPLLPNYKYVPIGYHGRASSLVPSGTNIRRPMGQIKPNEADAPIFAPTRSLDYEAEIGFYVGPGNLAGERIPVDVAEAHVFGLSIVNDWSARDIQSWEYQPLGPFLSKSFATTVSPWVVTLDALAPFRVPAFARAASDPAPLPYLATTGDGGIDITIEVWLATGAMREAGTPAVRVSRGNFRDMYWTIGQMVAHHTSNGCNLRPGDLLASGTISGPTPDSLGCLLERTRRGAERITLPSGETRAFLEDGDEVIMRAYCERPGAVRIGFGECRGIVR